MIGGINRNKLYDSLIRLQRFPIDSTEIFETTADLVAYLKNDETAYIGQLVRVKDNLEIPDIYLIFKDNMQEGETLTNCAIRLLNVNDFTNLQQMITLETSNRIASVEEVSTALTNYMAQINSRINAITSTISEEQKRVIENIILSSYYTKGDIERIVANYATKEYVQQQIINIFEGNEGETGNLVFQNELETALADYYSKTTIDQKLAAIGTTTSGLDTRLTAVEGYESRISDLETDVGNIETDITGIETRIGDVEDLTPGTTLATTISGLSNDITEISGDISDLETTTSNHTSSISEINSQLSELSGITEYIEKSITKTFNSNSVCEINELPTNAEISEIIIKILTVPSNFVEKVRDINDQTDVFYAAKKYAGGTTEFYKLIISNRVYDDIQEEQNLYFIDSLDMLNAKVDDKYEYEDINLKINLPSIVYCLDMSEYTGITGEINIKYYEKNI